VDAAAAAGEAGVDLIMEGTSGEAAAAVVRVAESARQFSQRLLVPLGSALGLLAAQPADEPALTAFASSLLDGLHGARGGQHPPLPIRTHAERINSGDRGISLAGLRAIRGFYEKHGGLERVMGDVCKEEGYEASVVAITRPTGLSLAESLVHAAGGDARVGELVGRATSFFSYSWNGTRLGDMLWAIERKVVELEQAAGGRRPRFVWVDMFCASQTLLAGVFRDAAVTRETDPVGYKARKEDTDSIFDDALDAIDEIMLYASPMAEEWRAPPQQFLLPERGSPPADWVRRGPGAVTRAWCCFELVKALAKRARLHVVLSPADAAGFAGLLTARYGEIAKILSAIDVRDAQISKVDDREYILGEVAKLDGGLGQVTSVVVAALRGWLQAEARKCLEGMPRAERGTSALIDRVATMLQAQGKLVEAEALFREALDACRETLGDRHPSTLVSIGNMALLLKAQGKLVEAEALYREDLDASRETLGDRHPSTLVSINNMALLLKAQGKLVEAEALSREARDAKRPE
jgi:tetratricopeptide (TPR) repeat protein